MDKKAIMEGIVIAVVAGVFTQLTLALILPLVPENGFIGVSAGFIAMTSRFFVRQ
ncbi:hypothetical protein [Geminocystis herdmanii]|uniref:hypothetical protein n=1 Tax=Geminocystis herdmanii TaxID=669359 RepID=UPI000347E9EE|nr:hypothetical protein [Geminocystis herdmanii]